MKIMMENKRKQLAYIGIMLVCFGVTYWMWFGPKDGTMTIDPAKIEQAMQQSGALVPQNSGGSVIQPGTNEYLPYGSRFDIKILETEAYKNLITAPPLVVEDDELGRPNPFNTVGNDPISTSTPQTAPATPPSSGL